MRPLIGTFLLSAFLLSPPLFAQHVYPGWKLSQKLEDEERKKEAAVSSALQSGSIDKATFNTYFTKYYFNRWTKPDRISLINNYVRNDFLKNDLGKATGDARKMLLDITVKAMKKMKSDPDVYPVAQLNAVVVLGNLYEDPAKTIPYGPAIPVLIEEFKNEKSPEANKIVALDGIVRYAYLGIADKNLTDKELPALLIPIATDEKIPEGRDPEIHNLFFRAKAVEGLGAICRNASPAAGESVDGLSAISETLLTILENKAEKSSAVRNHAMNAFAEMNLVAASAAGVKLDSGRIVDAITAFAKSTCDSQQKFIDELRRSEQVKTSTGGMGGMGGMPGGMSGGMPGGMSGGMSGGGMGGGYGMGGMGNDAKSIRRIEDCIASSKFAFGTIQNAIRGLSGARNETSIIALLDKENSPESTATVKMLNEFQKNIDEYIKFLNNGPPAAKGKSARGPSGMMGTTMSGTMGGPSGGKSTNAKAPKVTMQDIYNELTVLSTKFEELLSKAPARSVAAR